MRFVDRCFDADNPSWLKRAVVGFLLLLAVFRVWNAWHFNPYWGYDGGGHLNYIFSLADGHWPSMETNDVAWHEPLYYVLMSLVARIHHGLHTLGLVQATLSMAVAALSWLVIQKMTKSPWARVMSVVVWNVLPAVTMASAFVTNELLNYFFILLIVYIALDDRGLSPKPQVTVPWSAQWKLAVICGLALLTKISAAIAIAAVVIAEGVKIYRQQAIPTLHATRYTLRHLLPILLIATAFYTPWLIYKTQTGQSALSINNTAYMAPAPLALDSRIMFFLKFDADVFRFPFWYSGGRGFWSMLYADTFWDYGNMMKNPDVLARLPDEEKVATDRNGGYATSYKLQATSFLPYLAIPLALIMLLGAYKLIKSPFHPLALLSLLSLLSLFYFSYRYPFYDRGIVKSIFIAPGFLPMLAAGFTACENRMKQAWGKPVISALIFVYVATLLSTMTMAAQGY